MRNVAATDTIMRAISNVDNKMNESLNEIYII